VGVKEQAVGGQCLGQGETADIEQFGGLSGREDVRVVVVVDDEGNVQALVGTAATHPPGSLRLDSNQVLRSSWR